MRSRESEINAIAWLCWFGGAAMLPLVSRNPLYLTVSLLCVLFVHLSRSGYGSSAGAWRLFAYVGSSVAVLSIGFNVLTVHVGDREFAQLPEALPIIGGKLTYNALLYGISSALAISTLLLAAATFNSAVRHGDLLRLMPRSLSRLGIAGTVALTFVPQMVSAGRDIYQAQRARGHRYRRPADATALLVPLLATGMERAIDLSEALEVRGFGASAQTREHDQAKRALAGTGLVLALIATFALIGTGRLIEAVGVVSVVVLVLALIGRDRSRTRFRPFVWNQGSIFVAVSALGPLVALVLHFSGVTDLSFEPFPRLVSPAFHPLVGVLIALVILPVFLVRERRRQ